MFIFNMVLASKKQQPTLKYHLTSIHKYTRNCLGQVSEQMSTFFLAYNPDCHRPTYYIHVCITCISIRPYFKITSIPTHFMYERWYDDIRMLGRIWWNGNGRNVCLFAILASYNSFIRFWIPKNADLIISTKRWQFDSLSRRNWSGRQWCMHWQSKIIHTNTKQSPTDLKTR